SNIRFSTHGMVVRQNGGPGLFVGETPSGDAPPVGAVEDPPGDAKYEAGGVVSASIPNLDIVGSSILRPDPADCHPSGTPCYRVTMTISDLSNLSPPGGSDSDTNLVWLTQWLAQSTSDPVGGKNFFVFAESTAGGALTCFDGDSGAFGIPRTPPTQPPYEDG